MKNDAAEVWLRAVALSENHALRVRMGRYGAFPVAAFLIFHGNQEVLPLARAMLNPF